MPELSKGHPVDGESIGGELIFQSEGKCPSCGSEYVGIDREIDGSAVRHCNTCSNRWVE